LDDIYIIRQLEEQIGEEIPEVPYGHHGLGYHLNISGRVVSLNLFDGLIDASPIGHLTAMQRLGMREADITSLAPLHTLAELQYLDMSNCDGIDDIGPLAELPRLKRLSLAGTRVAKLNALASMQELQQLDLRFTPITDLSGLRDLQDLSFLDCSICNELTDFSTLSEMEGLRTLKLEGTGIVDLTSIAPLDLLKYLDLNYCGSIKKLAPLKGCHALHTLTLSHCTKVRDWPELAHHKGLWHLNLEANQLESLDLLGEMKELKWVNLSHNPGVTDLSPLKKLEFMKHIDLRMSGVTHLPAWLVDNGLRVVHSEEFNANTINVYGNPLQEPPLAVAEQGNAAVVQYFEEQQEQG